MNGIWNKSPRSSIANPTFTGAISQDATTYWPTPIRIGGTTSSFPAFRRNSARIDAILADASAYAQFAALVLLVNPDVALTAGGSTSMRMSFSSSATGIYAGSGAPTVSAPKGSLYLRSDGSGVSDRAYINTDGGTTWTALTTAA
jgi:hypothetical protein